MNNDLEQQIANIKVQYEQKRKRLSEMYHIDALVKEYLGLPKWFPLSHMAHLLHGVPLAIDRVFTCHQKPYDIHLVQNTYQEQLAQSKGLNTLLFRETFMAYRQFKGWVPRPNAKGTLAFPAHSSLHNETVTDWYKYAEELKALPEIYQPITVCLYWKDLLLGRHEPFLKAGLKIVTAGYFFDPLFCQNLYQYLTSSRFITSNEVGSYTFYGLEMGIPFFLHGDPVVYEALDNLSARNDPEFQKQYQKLMAAFRVVLTEQGVKITKEQEAMFAHYVGDVRTPLDKAYLRRSLYKSLIPILAKKVGAALLGRFKK